MMLTFWAACFRQQSCVLGMLLLMSVCATVTACSPSPKQIACREVMDGVNQVIVVATSDWTTTEAEVSLFHRDDHAGTWLPVGATLPAVIGRAGFGWGHGFEMNRAGQEPVKREGDGRTPAGVFRLGATFGFAHDPHAGHMALKPGTHICVDDVTSPYYGEIHARDVVGAQTHGEDMGTIPVYKQGIVINYPPNAKAKSGSCIFFHIWEAARVGTAGCIALQEGHVVKLQTFGGGGKTAVVMWPKSAFARLSSCIPDLPLDRIQSTQRQTQSRDETT